MKTTLPVLLLAVLLIGCGTENPFDRGEPFDEGLGPDESLGEVSFAANVRPALQSCTGCHAGGAGGWTYDGGGDAYDDVLQVVNLQDPINSRLLVKATGGNGHGGGALFSASSTQYRVIQAWIEQGAPNN